MIWNLKDIANMFEVVIGEEFEVCVKSERQPHKFRFTKNELQIYDDDYGWVESSGDIIYSLLKGEAKIIKKSWRPKYNDEYYFVALHKTSYIEAIKITWLGSLFDYTNYAIGNCFPTEKEAIAHMYEIESELKDIYDNYRGGCLIGDSK